MKGRVGIVLMVVGLVVLAVGIPGVVRFGSRLHQTIDAPSHHVPGQFTVHMTKGTWEVYDLVADGQSVSLGPGSSDGFGIPSLVPIAVSIHGPSGQTIPVTARPSNETLTLTEGSDSYRAVTQIHVHASGTYTFAIATEGGQGTSVLVARDLASVIVPGVLWGLLAVFGFLLAMIGLVVFLVKRRDPPPSFPGFGPPAGYGPPPGFGPPPGYGPPPGFGPPTGSALRPGPAHPWGPRRRPGPVRSRRGRRPSLDRTDRAVGESPPFLGAGHRQTQHQQPRPSVLPTRKEILFQYQQSESVDADHCRATERFCRSQRISEWHASRSSGSRSRQVLRRRGVLVGTRDSRYWWASSLEPSHADALRLVAEAAVEPTRSDGTAPDGFDPLPQLPIGGHDDDADPGRAGCRSQVHELIVTATGGVHHVDGRPAPGLGGEPTPPARRVVAGDLPAASASGQSGDGFAAMDLALAHTGRTGPLEDDDDPPRESPGDRGPDNPVDQSSGCAGPVPPPPRRSAPDDVGGVYEQ